MTDNPAQLDHEALNDLARAIAAIPRLAWLIVEIWLDNNGYILTPAQDKKPCQARS